MEEIIKNKLAFSIKKYNSQTRKTNFIDDLNLIKSQNIVYEIENFYVDFEMENDAKIDVGLAKFNEIYNRKPSSISNENLLFTFSVLVVASIFSSLLFSSEVTFSSLKIFF